MNRVLSHPNDTLRAGTNDPAAKSTRHARTAVGELEAVDDDTDEAITHGGYGVDDVVHCFGESGVMQVGWKVGCGRSERGGGWVAQKTKGALYTAVQKRGTPVKSFGTDAEYLELQRTHACAGSCHVVQLEW